MTFEESFPNERLRRARHLKGWTQSDLAEVLDTDFETVSRWERGIAVPSSYYRGKLCDVLGKTPEELGLISDRSVSLPPFTSPCIFLSSSYTDARKEVMTQLKADLQTRGFDVVSSHTMRRHGTENRRKVLQEVIRIARVVLLIVSPEARSSRHIQDTLLIARIYRRPVCAIWIDGEHWQECVPKDCGELYSMIDARMRYDQSALDEMFVKLEQAWTASSNSAVFVSALNNSPGEHIEPRNPYKGLKAFQYEDRHDFFGRDTLIDELADALEASLIEEKMSNQCTRFLAVVGPSGSGKSSIVLAGLLPRVQAGGLPGSDEWVYLDPIVPGAHPIESLALTLLERLPDKSLKTIREDLVHDSGRGLHLLASALSKRQGTRVVLFVDQFEEMFTQATAEEERQSFIDVLVTAITEPHGPLVVILTLRADFYDRPMHYQELGQLIQKHHKPVLPMEMKDLQTVIESPAGLPDVHLSFEGDLVGDLLFEVQGQVGALPLLQFTLDQLFQLRSGNMLTLLAYHEIGGVKGALAKHAEATYAALPSDEHRRLARALFLRLIDPGTTEQETTRSRARLDQLSLPDPIQTHILQETIEAFISGRLLTTNTMAGVPTLEVSHEALIREWPRLTDWLRIARSDILLQRAIGEDALEWIQHSRPVDRLYRGTQLDEAQAWAERNVPSIDEVAFLQASVEEYERQKATERAREAREQDLQQRAANRQRYVIGMMAVTTVVLVIALLATLLLQGQLQTTLTNLQRSLPVSVTNFNDNGPGSLRQAIETASSGSVITFASNLKGTITLTGGELKITRNLTISGPGASILAVSGGNTNGVFYVSKNVFVTIIDLTAKNGNAAFGGGIHIENGGTLVLINSTISNNTSDYYGGGIYNGGSLALSNSTISNNRANRGGADGGGIYNNGSLTLTNCTISGNTASEDGGGIYNGGVVSSEYCTVYSNAARTGGGINTTGSYIMKSSIIARNQAHRGPDIWGPLTSDGYNLIQDFSGATFNGPLTIHQTDIPGNQFPNLKIDPMLRYNGGQTQTHALLKGSPAIDKIPRDVCDAIPDQRGVTRLQGSGCDIGAYEYVPAE